MQISLQAILGEPPTNELLAPIPIPNGYQETIVTPKASRSVEAYWSFTANKVGRSLVLPDGRCDIIVRDNIHRTDVPLPIITGPATEPYTVEYEVGDRWLGIRLRPDKGVALWRSEIAYAADTVLRGKDAVALMPGLAKLKSCEMTMANLAKVAEAPMKLSADQRLTRALDALHASGGRIRIEKLARFAGCTSRHLNRMFRSTIGLSTKTYAQLVQFHRTLKLIQHEHLPITDAAFEGGYADHAHLTRAFRRYGGFTPSDVPDDLPLPMLFS